MPKLSECTLFASVFCCIGPRRPPHPSRTRRVRKGALFVGLLIPRLVPKLYRDVAVSRAAETGSLQVERGLDLAELVELGLGAIAHSVFTRVGYILLGVLDGLRQLGRVKLDEVDGRL